MRDWPFAKVAAQVDEDYDDHIMVCLKPERSLRERYASMDVTTEDIDDLHITLGYFGQFDDVGGLQARERLHRACYGTALSYNRPVVGKINGFGWFLNDESHVLVALWDIPYLAELRQFLMANCEAHGFPLREENHGFTPHMTLGYVDQTDYTIPRIPSRGGEEVTFESIWMVWGTEWNEIPLV